ncbi:MAG: tetratricopeptide repeat protein, partial [Elusimicrobiota bacterium]
TMRSLIEDEKLKLEHGRWKIPLDVTQLEIPTSIGETVMRRLQLLSEDALRVIQIGSVMGRELDLTVFENVFGFEKETIFKMLDELIERQFIKREERKYSFTHDRVRETLYGKIDKKTVAGYHEKIGNYIESNNEQNNASVVNLLSYHFSRSEVSDKAVKYLLMSADESFAKASYVETIDVIEKVLSILEGIEYPDKEQVAFRARMMVLNCQGYAVKPEFCMDCCEKIMETLYGLAGSQKTLINVIKVMQLLMKTINLLPMKLADAIKVKFLIDYPSHVLPKKMDYMNILTKLLETCFMYAASYFFLGKYNKAMEYIEFVEENYLPEKEGSVPYACLEAARGIVYCAVAKVGLGMIESEESVNSFTKYAAYLNRLQLFLYTSSAFWYNNHLAQGGGKDYVEKFREISFSLCEKYNFVDWLGWEAISDEVKATVRGHYGEAQLSFNKVSDLSKKMGRPFGLESWIYCWWCLFCMKRGDFEGALRSADKVEKVEKAKWNAQLGYARLVKCMVTIYKGEDPQKNLSELESVVSVCREGNFQMLGDALTEIAKVYIMINKYDLAREVLSEAALKAEDKDYFNPKHQIMIYRGMGELAIKEKEYEDAEKMLMKSLSIAKECDNLIQKGLTYKALAELQIALTKYDRAKEYLKESATIFTDIENNYELNKVEAMQDEG